MYTMEIKGMWSTKERHVLVLFLFVILLSFLEKYKVIFVGMRCTYI